MLETVFFHNSVRDYLIALGVFAGAIFFLKAFEAIGLSRLRKLAVKTESTLDDFLLGRIRKDANPIFYAAAFWVAIRKLTLSGQAIQIINGILTIVITFFGVRFAAALATFLVENRWAAGDENDFRARNLRGMATIIRGVLWSLGVVFVIDNLGFQISAIVAGLGIGGVAVALAAQAILSDLFSYAAIFFDRPFEIDDFIIVGEYMGTIEHIGLKTTRIRSLGGEQIIIANSDLTNSRVRNYKRMEQRRVVFRVGVTYDTPLGLLTEIPHILKSAVIAAGNVTFDRAHLAAFGDFSILYEIVFYVLSSDYNIYMDVQQAINLTIKREFDDRAIDFAFPTQTLHISAPEIAAKG